MARPDLRALTDDGLIQLANAGLVKRALREVAAGQGPDLAEAGDGTVEARFADGTVTRLGPGRPPGEASCTCPASGMCRHRVALVVAYRAAPVADGPADGSSAGAADGAAEGAAVPAAAPVAWDPGTLDGAALEAGLGGAAAAELRRLLAGGITVGLERGAVPAARLPTATVRFLVPDAVGYARCDCAAGGGCAHVALAIRAFRDSAGAPEIRLGGAALAGAEAKPAEMDLAEAADRVVAGLLEAGVVSGPEAHGAALVRLRRAAERRGATQLLLAEADLDGQVAAYAARHAAYDAAVVLALATELLGRVRGGEAALGLGQPYETAMGKTRLVSLGARLLARGRGATARVALADTDTGALLALERAFAPGEAEADIAAGLPGRLLSPGLSVSGTGQGQILTSVARRRADGLLALGQGARGRTALLPRDALVALPAPLAARDVPSILRRLADRPPVFLRPRDRLEAFHVFPVEAVLGQAWAPGAQTWQAAVALPGAGGTLHLARAYDPAAPHALDALAGACAGRWGPVRQVAGPVRIEDGALVCDPWSVSVDRLVVPDLAVPDGAGHPIPPAPDLGPATLLDEAAALLANALHAGRRAFAASARASGADLVARLAATGYPATAARLSAFLSATLAAPGAQSEPFARAALWVAAMRDDPGLEEA
ncbi:SWIM zinc finger [Methylobacterium sp. 275MFSha3.1]|uniref:SWIM zinc finger family protein n=1 Tax=Methylobacterium sp. 275MFSha3.1 TaxID=1502746 RepID=UPI0008A75884|nr:SWIM zinc finger family protein [Methylobacterium sp. 275MFSha3.1]SEH78189.1 SWIM zinc finger [Methylobacterium sp. 275MFSha3.1]